MAALAPAGTPPNPATFSVIVLPAATGDVPGTPIAMRVSRTRAGGSGVISEPTAPPGGPNQPSRSTITSVVDDDTRHTLPEAPTATTTWLATVRMAGKLAFDVSGRPPSHG